MEEQKTILWWRILSGLATVNICLWVTGAFTVEVTGPYIKWQLFFSGTFTAVCAFRSYFPRICLERYCLFDRPASSIILGRSAATIAEVSFAFQVGLMIHEMGTTTGISWLQNLLIPIVFLLTVAQFFCWLSVLSLNHLGHAIEESLWAFTFLIVGVSLFFSLAHLDGNWFAMALGGSMACALYVLFMLLVDIPMYISRWKEGLGSKNQKMGLKEGWNDALRRRVPTRDWKIWKPEAAWLTGYFTIAVWISLAITFLPRG
ncbi:hypothetical protein OAK75_06025 [Bacteriovoracales bacterium]|nr:hypothetical protein [Bacteriovoracales bacterium]